MCLSFYIPQNYSQPNFPAYSIEQKMGEIVTKKNPKKPTPPWISPENYFLKHAEKR